MPALARVTLPLKVTAVARVRPPPSSCKVPPLRISEPKPKGLQVNVPPETVLLAATWQQGAGQVEAAAEVVARHGQRERAAL